MRAIQRVTVSILSSLVTTGATHPHGTDMPHVEAPRSCGVWMGVSPRGFHLLD